MMGDTEEIWCGICQCFLWAVPSNEVKGGENVILCPYRNEDKECDPPIPKEDQVVLRSMWAKS